MAMANERISFVFRLTSVYYALLQEQKVKKRLSAEDVRRAVMNESPEKTPQKRKKTPKKEPQAEYERQEKSTKKEVVERREKPKKRLSVEEVLLH